MSALEELKLLSGEPSPDFDIFPMLASMLLGTPIAAITLLDRDTQWIKAAVGIDEPSAPRTHSICEYALLQPSELLTIQDAKQDPRVSDKPSVAREDGIRAYAGIAINSPAGVPLGALCVADQVPRTFPVAALQQLRELASGVEAAIRLHAAIEQDRQRTNSGPVDAAPGQVAAEFRALIASTIIPMLKTSFRDHKAKLLLTSMFARIDAPILLVDKSGNIIMANAAFRSLVGFSPDELSSMSVDNFVDTMVGNTEASDKTRLADGQVYRCTCRITTKAGGHTNARLTAVNIGFDQQLYKVVTLIPLDDRAEQQSLPPECSVYASQSTGEFRPVSLAALRSTLGDAWTRISLRAMLSAERIIRKRLNRDDVITRLDDETFAIWFNNNDSLQNDEALAVIHRELRVRLLTEFGDELKTYLRRGISDDDETLVTDPHVKASSAVRVDYPKLAAR